MLLKSVLLLILLLGAMRAEAFHQERILIIHSYHQGFLWTDTIEQGIRETFAAGDESYELYSEYYDTKRFSPASREKEFLDYLQQKYAHLNFSLIITSDDNAYQFMLKHRNEIAPGRPIIFCGLNNYDTYEGEPPANSTGIAEDFDVLSNLRLIARLHGEQTLVAVVADGTESGTLNLGVFARAAESPEAPPLQYEILFDLDLPELIKRLWALPENAVVLNLGFWRDSLGRPYSHRESIFTLNAPGLPVYTCWDHMIQYETVGGIALDGTIHGSRAAEMAIAVLSGIPISEIPVDRSRLTTPIFDYMALSKHSIPFGRLPKNRIIRNLPDRIYYNYPEAFATAVTSFSVLFLMMLLLLLNILLRKQAQTLFKSLFDSAPDVILVHDKEGRILTINRAVEQVHGYSQQEALGLRIQELNNAESAAGFNDRLNAQLGQGRHDSEVVHLHRDGHPIELASSAVKVNFQGKEAVLAILRDVSDRNRIEREIEQSAHEKEILLKEIHHRVKNNLQIVISLLRLHAEGVEDPMSREILLESENRIGAMAGVHEMLYSSENISSIDISRYLRRLLDELSTSYRESRVPLETELESEAIELHIDQAIPLGIIITELVTNSIKYARRENSCRIELELTSRGNLVNLEYRDNGEGFDLNGRHGTSLGLELIRGLTKQLDGSLVHDGKSGYRISFPVR